MWRNQWTLRDQQACRYSESLTRQSRSLKATVSRRLWAGWSVSFGRRHSCLSQFVTASELRTTVVSRSRLARSSTCFLPAFRWRADPVPHSCYWCQSHRCCRHWVSRSAQLRRRAGPVSRSRAGFSVELDWLKCCRSYVHRNRLLGTVSVDVQHHVYSQVTQWRTPRLSAQLRSQWVIGPAACRVGLTRPLPPSPPPPPTNTEVASLHSKRQVTLTDRPSLAGLVPQVRWRSGLWRLQDSDPVILLREERCFYANVFYCLIILLNAFFITY